MTFKRLILPLAALTLLLLTIAAARLAPLLMGPQPDGGFIVSTAQRIEPGAIAFNGRPIDLALHPKQNLFAVLNKSNVFLATPSAVIPGSSLPLGASASFRGLAWSPDGARLFASTDQGHLQTFLYTNNKLKTGARILLQPEKAKANPVPGGLAINRAGTRLYVAAANRNAVIEIDLANDQILRELPVQTLPFEPRLSLDEKTLVVSNWGGRIPLANDHTGKSQDLDVVSDSRGAPASGTVSLINLGTAAAQHVEVGIHPTGLALTDKHAYVANAMSDSVSEVDLASALVTRTFPLRWGALRLLGSMPNALALHNQTLYVANGGDNALAEIDLPSGKVLGFRHAGFFPVAVALTPDAKTALVLNTKGNGSVAKTSLGKPGNAHDFQGTITPIDLAAPLAPETALVASNNRWESTIARPALQVYQGAIKHVIYIIKENRTYDEVFGDLPGANGDPALCSLGETVMPNHRKLAREFTLFDNGYVSGTNSADGHNWSTQALANDYLEHFYVGYSRSYPDDGDDVMALSNAGAIWDAALKKNRSVRVYGEFCDEKLAKIDPPPKDWFEVWADRKQGTNRFKFSSETTVPSLKPLINRQYQYWPLYQSDQHRADIFIREYEKSSRENTIPNLMILSLPCDHGEGVNPVYPTPRAMMADNDLALGRIVEAVSKSPQWKETCIFVIEDDAQSGPDHVDGHRTVFMAVSPYNRRQTVDSTLYTTTHMIRSIEMMLGLDPLNRFDALSYPLSACFSDTLDLTPYQPTPNNVPLDERNPSGPKMTARDREMLEKTLALDWSHIDAPDPYWLNRINWYSIFKDSRPYPARPGEQPGQAEDDDKAS